ncbi:MAG: aminotransferase class V-fold PLP-dependent enzyme [Clostridiales bacterium]|nr:aminotransferase class V-fold PLP-dependent enzyme [Clostridiales bacterium]
MNSKIYFDNNATTQCDEHVIDSMLPYFRNNYGNPSSIYSFGKEIKEEISKSRENIAKLLNADKEEIIFTSCASESNVSAIMNAINNNPNKKHIITTKVEHASIIETMKNLETKGYNITYLSVDNKGRLNLDELKKSITDDTLLISIMMANNEIGNIYPIQEIGQIAKEHNILFHCDAVQAVGKVKIDVKEMNIDTLSLSGHKIHAPKGIGVLYVKKDLQYTPLIFGHQEKNKRGGTENVPYIIGLGKAAELLLEEETEINTRLEFLRNKLEKEIKENITDVHIYGDLENRLPNTSSIAFKGIKGEEILLVLESYNIYVGTGSACNSELAEPSHVLVACNANLEDYSPIRISLGKYNTEKDIETFIKILTNVVNMLRRRK